MSAISWNCRGLGNPLIVKALQKVVLEKDPILVFLMETKLEVSEMDEIKRKIERQQGLVVPSVQFWGGGGWIGSLVEKLNEGGCIDVLS